MSPQLDAFGIVVSDLSRSLPFYRKLGLNFPDDDAGHGHVEAQLPGGLRVMLDTEETVRSFDPEWQRAGHAHGGAFRCESPQEVDRLYAELLQTGGTKHMEPMDAFWGQRYAQVRDPDGTVIDLYAPL